MFKYGKRVVQIEKWTGGGKSTLIRVRNHYCTTVALVSLVLVQYQSRKFTMTEMAISTPTYYTLKYLGGITHVPVLRCTNYIQVVYFFGGFAPFWVLSGSSPFSAAATFRVATRSVGVSFAISSIEEHSRYTYIQEAAWCGLEHHRTRAMTANARRKWCIFTDLREIVTATSQNFC